MELKPLFCGIVCVMFLFSAGCGGDPLIASFKEKNKTNVAKVSTCFSLYASRNGMKAPPSQDALVEFLGSGAVDKNLERIGITPDRIEDIFISERDGEPLKVRWGVKINPDMPTPIAFETVGVEGVRLVAAETVLEVTDDKEYEDLWNGIYEPAFEALRKGSEEY